MLTGNHHHANAGIAAFLYSLPCLNARRIIHVRQTDEYEIPLHRIRGEVGGGNESTG